MSNDALFTKAPASSTSLEFGEPEDTGSGGVPLVGTVHLVFERAPVTSTRLVFGEVEGDAPPIEVTLAGVLPFAMGLSGVATGVAPPMGKVHLLFERAPATSTKLVFGGTDEPVTTVVVTLSGLVLFEPTFAGVATTGRPPGLEITGDLQFAMTLTGAASYDVNVSRPMVHEVAAAWQQAVPIEVGRHSKFGEAAGVVIGADLVYQQGVPVLVGIGDKLGSALTLRLPTTRVRHQQAWRVGTRPIKVRHQSAVRLRAAATEKYQQALPLTKWESEQRHQDAIHLRRGGEQRHQVAQPVGRLWTQQEGAAQAVTRSYRVRYQQGMKPPPGTTPGVVVPPVRDLCYVPSTDLLFSTWWVGTTDLQFYCERHDVPPPEPGTTVVVPIQRVYFMLNEVTLYRVDGNVLLPTFSLGMSLDRDSFTWRFSASLPGQALAALQPGMDGDPVVVQATVNGTAYRFLVEQRRRERTFAQDGLQISGRGLSALLDAPYAAVQTFGNDSTMTAQQLLADVLTENGVPLGWTIDWQLTDWLVPAGRFAHQGTYISAANAIAQAAGGYLQPVPLMKTLRVLPQYPNMPWAWGSVSPDFEIPSAVTTVEGMEFIERPAYNRVFVSGQRDGDVTVQVDRNGTDGGMEAPMITDPLITAVEAGQQRGSSVLANTGAIVNVNLQLPVLPATGIIVPGKYVRYVDENGVVRMGLTRSVAVDVSMPDVYQNLEVETHA